MEKEQTLKLLEHLKQSKLGFYIDPKHAVRSWHNSLEPYSQNEVLGALDWLNANTDALPTHRSIKSRCDQVRYSLKQQERKAEAHKQYCAAEESFKNVPGKNRTEQVIYIQAECSAEHWRNGETDNDYYNGRMLKAKQLGYEFHGVDYSKIKETSNAIGFAGMAMPLPWE